MEEECLEVCLEWTAAAAAKQESQQLRRENLRTRTPLGTSKQESNEHTMPCTHYIRTYTRIPHYLQNATSNTLELDVILY